MNEEAVQKLEQLVFYATTIVPVTLNFQILYDQYFVLARTYTFAQIYFRPFVLYFIILFTSGHYKF